MVVVSWWLSHALALWRVAIATTYSIHVRVPFLMLLRLLWLIVLTRHRRFANVPFRLTEEEVLVCVSSNLKVHNMAHVFEVLKLVMELLLIVFLLLLTPSLLLSLVFV